ncbi:DUF4214 domain-containing protein [Mameliella sp. AT18]|uniref:DUF4214 domain-containing protein n=1 Tax=Mameliella sp. AT18 TaxID=3028385 RepID=UPI0008411492|nr:DUF4214 domain-containing protein [Mameliella sp. AT18]MDD9729551.1 DUF4214 domain-containing protein [Mameliella sp. AT18]ODM49938.1 hypothetical protein A9320_12980 [Ruegeria sp. PBVC088]
MAHLASNYDSFETFLDQADAFWTVDLGALNSSGVQGTAVLAMVTDDDGSTYLNVAISATGLTPSQTHAQHIHGLFDENGTPIDSVAPTIADDLDRDGMVEVLEGVSKYGDVILPLSMDGMMPMADASGRISFVQSYDLGDNSNFFSPVTMTDYFASDLMPLELREIVLHGVEIPDGIGTGTGGEVAGGENGYIGILPAAAGSIEVATREEAFAVLAEHRETASDTVVLTPNPDMFDAGPGDDMVDGLAGDDTITGGADNDSLMGGLGADILEGNGGNDMLDSGQMDVNAPNAADAGASGGLTLAQYDGGIAGGAGNDMIMGGAGDEILTGDDDSRTAAATGSTFDAMADGMDTIHGGAGNDEIHTGSWSDSDQGLPNAQTGIMADVAYGDGGDDILRGAGGDDMLFGNMGADNIGGGGGDDMIYGDGMFTGDIEGITGQIYRLYVTAFDRDPDGPGFESWATGIGTGSFNLSAAANGFANSPEFNDVFGGGTNEDFVRAMYQNTLDRGADPGGLAHWVGKLDAGASRAEVLLGFSESPEMQMRSASDMQDWIDAQGTNDVIAGNGGTNTLSGGYLSDTFVFGTDTGSSHIVTDLESWDMLDFTAFGYADADAAIAQMMQQGDDVVFMDQDVTVTLEDTQLGQVSSDMIMV